MTSSSFSAKKQPTLGSATSHTAPQSAQGKQIVARGLAAIEGLVGAAQAASAKQAAQAVRDATAAAGLGSLAQPGLGGSNGLDINGQQQHHDTDKYSIPIPGMPTQRDLTSQDDGGDRPDMTHSHDGAGDSHRGSVWTERSTERSSSDGTHTWGSASYRDWSGNFWRSDYQIERGSDGSTTSKETVFDNHNEPIKTTVIYTAPDGSEKVTTTDHQTGQTTTTQGQVKPEEPETEPEPKPDKNQGETSGYTGGPFHPHTFTSPNKVNPGPDGGDNTAGPLTPVFFDPKILVTDPVPDQAAARGAMPRDIRQGNINNTTIDPPRPQ